MQLLICIENKRGKDLKQTTQLPDRGDVIHIAGDDHVWGREEVKHPFFRVIRVPDITETEARALLAPEPDHHEHVSRSRAFRLDLDILAEEHHEFFCLDSDHCHESKGVLSLSLDTIRKIKVRKKIIANPNVIGPLRTNIIGPR